MLSGEWRIFFFRKFHRTYTRLMEDVEKYKRQNPDGYENKLKTRLLKALQVAILTVVKDPLREGYFLEEDLIGWQRIKLKGEQSISRYRLFFKAFEETKEIIFIWLNDEKSLRKKGSNSDVYEVFPQIIRKEKIVPLRDNLVDNSKLFTAIQINPDDPSGKP